MGTRPGRDPGYALGVVMVLCAGLCLSTGGLLLRLVQEATVWEISFYRSLALSATLLVYLLICYGRGVVPAFRRMGWPGLGISLCLGVGSICYLVSLSLTTVANTMFILATAPLLTAGLSRLFLGERIHRITLIAMFVALGGIGIMASQGFVGGRLIGNLVAFGAVLLFAVMLTLMRFARDADMVPGTCVGGLMAALLSLPMVDSFVLQGLDFTLALLLGSCQVGAGFLLITLATRRVPAAEVSLLAISEVILAPVWVWIFVAEVPHDRTLVGGSLVLTAVVAQALYRLRQES